MDKRWHNFTEKEWKEHCKRMSSKSPFMRIFHEFFNDPEYGKGQHGWLNGNITAYNSHNGKYKYPFAVDCTVGNGYLLDGKQCFYSNTYYIVIHNGCYGLSVVKYLDPGTCGIKNKYFMCGDSPKPVFGDLEKFESHEKLNIDEILYLCNKDWLTFKNVNLENKYNFKFLEEFKNQFIKRLLYCNVIYYDKTKNKYIDYELHKFVEQLHKNT